MKLFEPKPRPKFHFDEKLKVTRGFYTGQNFTPYHCYYNRFFSKGWWYVSVGIGYGLLAVHESALERSI